MGPSTIIGPVCFRLGVCRFPISGFVLAALAVVVYGVGQGEPLEQEGPCRGFDRVLGVVIINTQYRRWTVSVWCAQKTTTTQTHTSKQHNNNKQTTTFESLVFPGLCWGPVYCVFEIIGACLASDSIGNGTSTSTSTSYLLVHVLVQVFVLVPVHVVLVLVRCPHTKAVMLRYPNILETRVEQL